MEMLYDAGLLAHALLVLALALPGALALAAMVRLATGARARRVHLATLAGALTVLSLLIALTLGVESGLGMLVGLGAAVIAGLGWLLGAALARVRPVWVDVLVIALAIAFFAVYDEVTEVAHPVPPIFAGTTEPGTVAAP